MAKLAMVWLWLASGLAGYEIGHWLGGGYVSSMLFGVGLAIVGPICIAEVQEMDAHQYRMEGAVRESREETVRGIMAADAASGAPPREAR